MQPPAPEVVANLVIQGRIARRATAIGLALIALVVMSCAAVFESLSRADGGWIAAGSFVALILCVLAGSNLSQSPKRNREDLAAAFSLVSQAAAALDASTPQGPESMPDALPG